jgi:hypothetical protein
MPKIRYVGSANVRNISKDDFMNIKVSDQDSISVDTDVSNEVEVSQSASDWLLENEKDDWELVKARRGDS